MTTCPSCGHVNEDDTDFCVRCREYLRWDPTEVRPPPQQAATAPAPVATAVPPQTGDAGAVRVTLRSADGQASTDGGRAPVARVTPGAQTSVSAVVRNELGIVDTYALRVEGLPEGWWTVTPQSIHLLPFGSNDSGYEQDVEVSLHPPRAPASEARAWPFRLVASSGVRAGLTGAAAGSLVVERYDELACQLRPERATARRSARYAVVVRNRGNAPVTVSLTATDPDDLLSFAFAPTQLQLGAGAERTVDLHVQTTAPAADRERELRFSVAASSDDATATSAGVFVQPARELSRWGDRSWLLWLRVALTLLAATLLIAGSFAYWTDDGGIALRGACVNGGVSACLDYKDTVDAVAQADVVPDPREDLPGIVYFVSSAGFLTILLGVVALAGLRRGRSTWLAGIVAVIALIVLAVQADALPGIWIPILGGVIAIVAGFLPVLASESGD